MQEIKSTVDLDPITCLTAMNLYQKCIGSAFYLQSSSGYARNQIYSRFGPHYFSSRYESVTKVYRICLLSTLFLLIINMFFPHFQWCRVAGPWEFKPPTYFSEILGCFSHLVILKKIDFLNLFMMTKDEIFNGCQTLIFPDVFQHRWPSSTSARCRKCLIKMASGSKECK